MSSIYLYIIYISRPWFKGSGAAAGSGSISDIHSLMPFCRYAIVHTNHHFARKREYSDGHPSHFLLQLVGKTDACQRVLIKNTPDVVRRPACFVVKGVQGSRFRVQGSRFKVQGSGLWWRLRRDPSTQVATVLAFVISHATFLAAQDDETGRCPKVVCKSQVTSHLGLLIPASRLQIAGVEFSMYNQQQKTP